MTMKRYVVLLSIIMCIVGTKAFAYDIAVENADGVAIYYNYINDKKELAVSSGKAQYSGSVKIPESVTYMNKNFFVTSIGKNAFKGCKSLTSVTIPNSVTSIGEDAFYECKGLTFVHISDLEAWCKISFKKSSSNPLRYAHHLYLNGSEITNLVIPNSVTSIGDYAFNECIGLISVTIGNSVTSIGNMSFAGCRGLTSVNISDLEAWCKISFKKDSSNPLLYAHHLYLNGSEITNLVIPNNVTRIENYAFMGCNGLTSVTIPNSVTSIGDFAFSDCIGLISVTIGNSVTSIGVSAFFGCSSLTSVTIPNSVETIWPYAFEGCSGLTSVTIPNSVEHIFHYTFLGCSGLTSVTIPNSVITIGSYAFMGCNGLTSVTIPNSVITIGEESFSQCRGLTSVTIGNCVRDIHYEAFSGCKLSEVISMNVNPSGINSYAFSYDTYSDATLFVPVGSIEKYKKTLGWENFKNIVEGIPSGIKTVLTDEYNVNPIYDLNGKLLSYPNKGINIIGGKKIIFK